MSKADEIRALREARHKQAVKPIEKKRGEGTRYMKSVERHPLDAPSKRKKLPVIPIDEIVDRVEAVGGKVATSHPDCEECKRRREQTRLRVQRSRKKRGAGK
jgi:hypothetical protein